MDKNQIGKSRIKLNIYKKSLSSLTSKQKEIAVGLLLRDVSIQTQNQGRTHRLKFEQSNKHKPYIDHLVEIFDPWVLSKPRLVSRTNKNKKVVQTWQFQTISHESFNELAKLFLNSHYKKRISTSIKENFTAFSLAYWFMDDGGKLDYTSNQGKAVVLNTQGFSFEEVKILKNMLIEKFKLKCWIKENKGKPIIIISGFSYEKLCTLIKPFIIPSMLYKPILKLLGTLCTNSVCKVSTRESLLAKHLHSLVVERAYLQKSLFNKLRCKLAYYKDNL